MAAPLMKEELRVKRTAHLRHVLVLAPLGDEEQLGQALGVLAPQLVA